MLPKRDASLRFWNSSTNQGEQKKLSLFPPSFFLSLAIYLQSNEEILQNNKQAHFLIEITRVHAGSINYETCMQNKPEELRRKRQMSAKEREGCLHFAAHR